MNGRIIILILLLVVVVIVISWLRSKFKSLNLPCVFFVSGGIKTGKTLLSVHLAIKEYRKAVFRWYFFRFLCKIFKKFDTEDSRYKPMLYSNLPLANVRYNPLTIDIINRKVRIPNKSIVLIDEVSLFADSQLFKDKNINNSLMLFYKLFGHYSHGGKLIIDSQSIADNHYSFKRCMSSYLYIYSRVKYPFISVLRVRELMYSEDGSIQNNFNEDVELSLRNVIIFNRTYDKYDCYALSVFTDNLAYQVDYNREIKSVKDDLKCYQVVSLNEYVKTLNNSIRGVCKNVPKSLDEDLNEGDYFIDNDGVVSQYHKVEVSQK